MGIMVLVTSHLTGQADKGLKAMQQIISCRKLPTIRDKGDSLRMFTCRVKVSNGAGSIEVSGNAISRIIIFIL